MHKHIYVLILLMSKTYLSSSNIFLIHGITIEKIQNKTSSLNHMCRLFSNSGQKVYTYTTISLYHQS